MERPAHILSLNSHVAYGHVGGAATIPAFQQQGFEVMAVPTVLFSNHPGHGGLGGAPVPAALIRDLLDGLAARGFLARCGAVHSGYFGAGFPFAAAIAAIEAIGPDAVYACDPILGDSGRLYVAEDVARAVIDELAPRAAILTPNRFELGLLAAREIAGDEDVRRATDGLLRRDARRVLVTSARIEPARIGTLALDTDGAWLAWTPRHEKVPNGVGDLAGALFLTQTLKGRDTASALAGAIGAVNAMIAAALADRADELPLVAGLSGLADPLEPADLDAL